MLYFSADFSTKIEFQKMSLSSPQPKTKFMKDTVHSLTVPSYSMYSTPQLNSLSIDPRDSLRVLSDKTVESLRDRLRSNVSVLNPPETPVRFDFLL